MKRVLIVGATSGIGHELALRYIAEGCCVGVAGRREEKLIELQDLACERVFCQRLDVTCHEAADKLMQLITKMGGIDLFILCSGIGFQNISLDPEIEIKTAVTNVEDIILSIRYIADY